MIKYTAKDIVNRASQLADLENSDFISWNENMNLLNECWKGIYQNLINNGDKYFIKEMNLKELKVCDNKYKLPCDFFQLHSIELTPSCRQIPRRAKSEPLSTLSYDMENDFLVIYGSYTEDIRVLYFPTPEVITLKNKDKDITDDVSNSKVMDCCKNAFFLKSKTENNSLGVKKCSIRYFTNNKHVEIDNINSDINMEVTKGVVGARGSYAFTTYNNTSTPFNIVTNYMGVGRRIWNGLDTNKSCLLKSNDEVGFVTQYADNKIRIRFSNRIYDFNPNESIEILPSGLATFREYYNGYYSIIIPIYDVNTNIYSYVQYDVVINDDTTVDIKKTEPFPNAEFGDCTLNQSYVQWLDGKLYVVDSNRFYENFLPLFDLDNYTISGINEINKDNGYGICLTEYIYGLNDVLLRSPFVDTVFEYPNNIYYNLMSIKLAMSYKIKQNADISLLSATYDDMESQYFNSLSRDVNNVTRITNVY